MSQKKQKPASGGSTKSFAKKRTLNPSPEGEKGNSGTSAAPADQQQDPARRLGNFEGKGEAPRSGKRGQ